MRSVFSGLLLFLTLTGFAALAQEADTSEAADESQAVATAEQQAQERDEIEPGVSSAVLSADIRRRTVGSEVMDELDLGRTEITGNQELPTVLYIVPWKKSDPGDLMGRPANTLLDEILAPLDRTEFVRQVDYYEDLYGESDE
ncbi:MAG: hypothetical protein GXP15_11840 [Gammaproteobacteria bacterium]|nr:hypothetical protein [Gammaproteobacteria bacterium]